MELLQFPLEIIYLIIYYAKISDLNKILTCNKNLYNLIMPYFFKTMYNNKCDNIKKIRNCIDPIVWRRVVGDCMIENDGKNIHTTNTNKVLMRCSREINDDFNTIKIKLHFIKCPKLISIGISENLYGGMPLGQNLTYFNYSSCFTNDYSDHLYYNTAYCNNIKPLSGLTTVYLIKTGCIIALQYSKDEIKLYQNGVSHYIQQIDEEEYHNVTKPDAKLYFHVEVEGLCQLELLK